MKVFNQAKERIIIVINQSPRASSAGSTTKCPITSSRAFINDV
jgi:hypothetical protein